MSDRVSREEFERGMHDDNVLAEFLRMEVEGGYGDSFIKPDKQPEVTCVDGRETLTDAHSRQLAMRARLRGLGKPVIEDEMSGHPDLEVIAGRMDVMELTQPQQPDFGSDDTDDFRKAQQRGGIYAD